MTDLEDWLRIVRICKGGSIGHDQRPDLTGDANILGYFDGIGDEIGTMVEVDDLIGCGGVESSLNGGSVVSHTISLGTRTFDADERCNGSCRVLRLGSLKDRTGSLKQTGWLGRGIECVLNSDLAVRALTHIANS